MSVSRNGPIYASNDWGNTWVKRSDAGLPWENIAVSPDGQRVVAAAEGHLYVSDTGGATWVQSSDVGYHWREAVCSDDGRKTIARASNNYIYFQPILG